MSELSYLLIYFLFSFVILLAKSQQIKKGKKKRIKKTHTLWSTREKNAVFEHLSETIKKMKVPGKVECEQCIRKSEPALDQRSWTAVKYFVKNAIERAKRLNKKAH